MSSPIPSFRRRTSAGAVSRSGKPIETGNRGTGSWMVIGAYEFEPNFLSRVIPLIISLGKPAEGADEGTLAGESGLSRGALKEILRYLETLGNGVFISSRFYTGTGFREKRLSPFEKQILQTLRRAGAAGLNPVFMRIRGALEVLEALTEKGMAVRLEENLYWSEETLEILSQRLLEGEKAGNRLSIAAAREKTGLSRRFVLPFMGILEQRGRVRREGDERVVLADSFRPL